MPSELHLIYINKRSTLRSQSFMAMKHLIKLVDLTQASHIARNKKTSSQFHNSNKTKSDVVLPVTNCTKKTQGL
ncbi:hypothetical protein BY996DRAFT_6547118 [Phakopsora pachyrhizi]|uniref:Uncharacterized protein n=1 Tax=Phakopsora pachyrhizi TaxID=170000 RepID=A0AAV0AUZ1_PHAPC|nr:hypothetical protein BY996DRAFT_6445074 [Phakopsora pachyrhizi]KAI8446139.1 hypothetical protein BY996DRAFT_6547118 [Phakopsora pachyrhizi]CAH7673730.1 hypothetical protein PPACK8108_LOCUS8617 [Phakopsora pachyrhizi]